MQKISVKWGSEAYCGCGFTANVCQCWHVSRLYGLSFKCHHSKRAYLWWADKPPHYTREELYIDGLVQERRNSSALAMELRLSCTNPSIYTYLNLKHK